jgi:hypothetical protein
VFGLAAALAFSTTACGAPHEDGAAPTAWSIRIASPNEPGQPLELYGSLRDRHGAPLTKRSVRVSQEDASGAWDRLEGTLRTDEYGRYRVRTVFPHSHGGSPAYVYFQTTGQFPPGEPAAVLALSAPDARGSAASGLRVVPGPDGVWRMTADLRPGYNDRENTVPFGGPTRLDRSPGALPSRPPAPPVRTRFTIEDSARSGR